MTIMCATPVRFGKRVSGFNMAAPLAQRGMLIITESKRFSRSVNKYEPRTRHVPSALAPLRQRLERPRGSVEGFRVSIWFRVGVYGVGFEAGLHTVSIGFWVWYLIRIGLRVWIRFRVGVYDSEF